MNSSRPDSDGKEPVLIAVISYGLPVTGKKRGGIECVAHDLADGLARRGHTVTIWTYDSKPDHAAYEVRCLPGRAWFRSWLGQRLTMGYFGNVLALVPNYGHSEAIIAHGDSLLLPLKGRPVVRVMHGSALGEMFSARTPWRFLMQLGIYLQELLTAFINPRCVGNSRNAARYNPFVQRTIPLGTNLNDFFPDPASKTPEPSILFVGTLDGRKRGSLLVDWFSRVVRPSHPSARLQVVGPQGPQVEGVTYYTGLPRNELALLYRSVWVYASPSTYEGFGLPYVEAMASGTAVIATPNPGSEEVLNHGHFGRLVPDSEFASVVNELLANRGAREVLAARGLERAQNYALDTMVESYENLLLETCAASKPKALGRDWTRHTDRFLGGLSLGYLQQTVMLVTGLWLTPFLLNHLGQHDLGVWLMITQILAYLALLDLGVIGLLPRETASVVGRGGVDSPELSQLVERATGIVALQLPLVAICAFLVWLFSSITWRSAASPLAMILIAFVALFHFVSSPPCSRVCRTWFS